MQEMDRRGFVNKAALALGAGVSGLALGSSRVLRATPRAVEDNISIAQWALVQEIREGKWKTLDFPQIAREVFDIDGIELVNTLLDVPTYRYLQQLKKNAADNGVRIVLIMVDDEGEPASPDRTERVQMVVNHRKWVDIAHYLGCHSIRTNCRPRGVSFEDGLNWAAESYSSLLDYAVPAGISVVIENHGTLSDDPDFIVALMEKVDSLYFGTLPDFKGDDPYTFVKKTVPYATGISFRLQSTDEETERLVRLCRESGYRGFYGIESSGRENIMRGKKLLQRVLFGRS